MTSDAYELDPYEEEAAPAVPLMLTEEEKKQWRPVTQANFGHNTALYSGVYIMRSPKRIPPAQRTVGQITDNSEEKMIIPFPFEDGQHSDFDDGIERVFPTIHFPLRAFESKSDTEAVQAWTGMFRDCLERAVEQEVVVKPRKKVDKSLTPSEQSSRSVQVTFDTDDMENLLSFVEKSALSKSFDVAKVLSIASASYYLGRLAERHEVRSIEDKVLSGEENDKRKLAAAAGTTAKYAEKRQQYAELTLLHMSKGKSYTAATDEVGVELNVTGRTVRDHFPNPSTPKE